MKKKEPAHTAAAMSRRRVCTRKFQENVDSIGKGWEVVSHYPQETALPATTCASTNKLLWLSDTRLQFTAMMLGTVSTMGASTTMRFRQSVRMV